MQSLMNCHGVVDLMKHLYRAKIIVILIAGVMTTADGMVEMVAMRVVQAMMVGRGDESKGDTRG